MAFFTLGCQHTDPRNLELRADSSMSGGKFMEQIASKGLRAREDAIFEQANKMNVPEYLFELVPVQLTHKISNKKVEATIWVMPDYFAIGKNSDSVRVPITPILAQKIADRFGMMLPTTKMVKQIHQSAELLLNPHPIKPSGAMTSVEAFISHNSAILRQVGSSNIGKLISGHKKDIVITKRHEKRPSQVAIYGWFRKNNRPIQPLSLVHNNQYADYSHGVRFIAKTMLVDGVQMKVSDVLKDKFLSKLISLEGALSNARIPGAVRENILAIN